MEGTIKVISNIDNANIFPEDTSHPVLFDNNISTFVHQADTTATIDTKGKHESLVIYNGEYKKWLNKLAGENIMPTMSSDANGKIVLSTNSTNKFSYFPYKAFDKSTVSNSGWANDSGQYPVWLKIDFGENKKIGKYSVIFSFNTPVTCFPKDWEFQGSRDNQNWDTLDSKKMSSWTLLEKKEFFIANPKEYRYYRFYVKSGDPTYVVFNEIELFEVEQDAYWLTVSTSLPSSTQFLEQGIDSLSLMLDREIIELEPIKMIDKSEILKTNEVGKMFSETVDLKKYLSIKDFKTMVVSK